jgi:hypothetical protein
LTFLLFWDTGSCKRHFLVIFPFINTN